MKMILTIELDNDAFHPNKYQEIARILRHVSQSTDRVNFPVVLHDINGNRVGQIEFEGS